MNTEEQQIEQVITKLSKRINWKQSDIEIYMYICRQNQNNTLLWTNRDLCLEIIARHKMSFESNVNSQGGFDMTVPIGIQDLQYLKSNDYDRIYGSHFLIASSDNGNTTSTYWINKDNTVTMLKSQKDELITQLCSDHILNDVLWPEFESEKQTVLDKLNNMCPFDLDIGLNKWPWGRMTNFDNEFQDSMSSWFLEHFVDKSSTLKFKAIERKDVNGEVVSYSVTEFTDIFPQLSKDIFINKFYSNISTLCGRYAKRLNDHPLPYSNSDKDYSFIKIDMNSLLKKGECPLWDLALKERLDSDIECEVFRAAIWQVYDPMNRSRQLIYLYDPHGRSGKSAMLRAAFSPIKQAQFACQKGSLNNNFGFAKVWNKQLVTVGDNKNKMLLKSQIIHTMTGGDEADVEYKGQNSFMAAFRGHVWANGNVMLDIDTDAEHEVSRLVLFNIKKPESAKSILYQLDENGKMLTTKDGKPLLGQGDPSWEEKLKAELPYFLYKCREDYKKYCPNHSDIILPAVMQNRIQDECAELSKQIFDAFFEDTIIFDPNYSCNDSDLRTVWTTWKLTNIEHYEVKPSDITYADLAEHLSKLKFKCTRVREDNKRIRKWPGICIKSLATNEEKQKFIEKAKAEMEEYSSDLWSDYFEQPSLDKLMELSNKGKNINDFTY